MSIDWTVSVGNILTGAVLLLGAGGVVWALRSDVAVLASRIGSIEAQMLKIADVLVHIGRQDERLNSHEKRIDRLEDNPK